MLALLACLFAWPIALSILILLELSRGRPLRDWILNLLQYLSGFPLIIFAFLFVEVLGIPVFEFFESLWIENFASSNILTQSLAFALTVLLYPLSVFPFFGEVQTVNLFYTEMLANVIDFASVGLMISSVILSLVIYIVPKMVLSMRKRLRLSESAQSLEVIRSLGGTQWEGIYLTVLQSMRSHFKFIIISGARICFFEGMVVFAIAKYLLAGSLFDQPSWSHTIASQLMFQSMSPSHNLNQLLILSGAMTICFLVFQRVEQNLSNNQGYDYGPSR
ncbi:MAG: hypothetical protein AAF203_08735 [Pseudomonadota bacterium]